MKLSKAQAWIKFTLPTAISLGLFIFIIFGVHMPEIKKNMLEQKKEHIRDLTKTASDVLVNCYMRFVRGEMTEQQAKNLAVNLIENMKFGQEQKDYFWITDFQPKMIMHPYRSDLNGKDLSDFSDPAGKKLFMDMVQNTAATGDAFVEYRWQWKDDSTRIIPKISYVQRFKPWQWIIGTGVYVDDIETEASTQARKLLYYTFSVFLFIVILSGYVIFSGLQTNRDLLKREQEMKDLNEGLEEIVKSRTSDLQHSLDELKSTQSQLIESEKMASLGNLVAGVAHEINTPLGIGVTSSTYLEDKLKELKKTYEEGNMKKSDLDKFIETGGESLKNITSNLLRASNLIKSFKQVAVDQSSEMPRTFNMKNYINDILMSLKPQLKKTRHEVIVTAPDDLEVTSYPGAYMQIFTNLILNSLVHGFEDIEQGKITIDVKQDGKRMTLTYSDNGKGMTQQQLMKIYEPFYTTKRNNGGSGLGMNIVYNLITRKLGGTIVTSSKEHHGTVFIITVPTENRHEIQ